MRCVSRLYDGSICDMICAANQSGHGFLTAGQQGLLSRNIQETQRFREFGLEKEYVVIRNVDEWIYCLNNKNGKISSWDRNEKNIC